MTTILIVAAGSALGGVSRYLMSGWVQGQAGVAFPWGTVAVNVSGCLVLGVLTRLLLEIPDTSQWRLFFAIGFCGAYTTLSTLSLEAFQLMRDREWTAAGAYLSVSVFGGLIALGLGVAAVEWLLRARG